MPEPAVTAGQGAWRPARPQDVAAVILAVQAVAHPAMQERAEVLGDKLRACPEGCRIFELEGVPAGYGLAHPWLLDKVPTLDGLLGALLPRPDCLFLHDVALLPAARGRGAGRTYVAAMTSLARRLDLSAMALVSVYGTVPIWERCGFGVRTTPALAAALAQFGPTARYMVRPLG